jgi:hypothetical protein
MMLTMYTPCEGKNLLHANIRYGTARALRQGLKGAHEEGAGLSEWLLKTHLSKVVI